MPRTATTTDFTICSTVLNGALYCATELFRIQNLNYNPDKLCKFSLKNTPRGVLVKAETTDNKSAALLDSLENLCSYLNQLKAYLPQLRKAIGANVGGITVDLKVRSPYLAKVEVIYGSPITIELKRQW